MDVYGALGDPSRRALIDALVQRNDQTLFELCVRLTGAGRTMSRQAVSKHLAVLRDAGLVVSTALGRTTVHHLDRAALGDARAWLESVLAPPGSKEQP